MSSFFQSNCFFETIVLKPTNWTRLFVYSNDCTGVFLLSLPSKHFLVFKTPWRRLQDMSWRGIRHVFSVTIFRLPRRLQDMSQELLKKDISSRRFQDMSSRRLQDVLQASCKDVLKTCLEDVLKTSWRNVLKISWRHVLRTSWRHFFKRSWRHVWGTPWRHFFKRSSRRLQDKQNL